MTTITIDHLVSWLEAFRGKVAEQASYLTELDSAIGDADHGTNMARGMTAVMGKLAEKPEAIDALGKTVGMTLVSAVGGTSGPLYGTLFLRFGAAAGAVAQLEAQPFAQALRAGFEGLLARGKAEPGDKTLVDAMGPALDALDAALADGADLAHAAASARDAAAAGRDATEPLVARKGRASYLGERSAGHIDPGAASAAMLFEALAEVLEEALGA